MECNKDEALRAKAICETKLLEKDFTGAKKTAQKAEKLFPNLEGLSHLFIILDVYISSEKKINGLPDWYRVLNVDPTADDETIKKSYRKLALFLHPDKNKSVGAEGAFKLVSEAWSILSDKVKRKMFDQKRNPNPNPYHPRPVYQKVSTSTLHITTFWTSCTKCTMHFEYMNVYLNQKLICTNCHEPFWALPIPGPPTALHPMWAPQKPNHNLHNPQNAQNAQNANHQVDGKLGGQVKRQHVVKLGSGFLKKRRVGVAEQSPMESQSQKVKPDTVSKVNNYTRELSNAEIRTMLMTKSKKEIQKKLNELNLEKESKKEVTTKKETGEIVPNGISTSKGKSVKSPSENTVDDVDGEGGGDDDMDTDTTKVDDVEAILMTVPDPDFHDFDMDRTERAFSENQIWAAYDEDDGMPRYYAMIHSVISRKPFKMEISWLNSKSNSEFAPINWVASGFPKTSGEFRIRKHEITTSLNSFSHKVYWEKGKKGIIQIYPKKDEVWAVYKNWSPKWNEFTEDEVIHKYDMVMVLEDYNEDKGIMVIPLKKVGGFKSVFMKKEGGGCDKEVWKIRKEEIFRLSHKVPYYLLTGEEKEGCNVVKGCLELDPAALPLELLKSTVEEKVNEVEEVKGQDIGFITYARRKGKNAKVHAKSEVMEEVKGAVLKNDGR